jgi:acyl dehydratase
MCSANNEDLMGAGIERDAYMKLVGSEIGVSEWHVLDQKRIDTFADCTEDWQFIHVDPERAARETPFGTTIAHGFLTLSMLSVFSYEAMPRIKGATMGVNYGFDRLRFISPVKAGMRVRGRFMLAEATLRKPGELLSRTSVNVEIEGEKRSALVADWLGLIYFE